MTAGVKSFDSGWPGPRPPSLYKLPLRSVILRCEGPRYSYERMHAALEINIPNYVSAIVTADEVVALDGAGRVVARLGEFRGLRVDNGSPDGLLFPASLVIQDGQIFVTNLADAYTDAVGDEPEESVKLWTVSRLALPA